MNHSEDHLPGEETYSSEITPGEDHLPGEETYSSSGISPVEDASFEDDSNQLISISSPELAEEISNPQLEADPLELLARDKTHSCSICAKTFAQSSELERHLRIHTGKKPYTCSSCSKSFSAAKHLKRHLRTHTGEKPFSCLLCTKSFPRSDQLKIHTQVHMGDRYIS